MFVKAENNNRSSGNNQNCFLNLSKEFSKRKYHDAARNATGQKQKHILPIITTIHGHITIEPATYSNNQ